MEVLFDQAFQHFTYGFGIPRRWQKVLLGPVFATREYAAKRVKRRLSSCKGTFQWFGLSSASAVPAQIVVGRRPEET